MSAGFESGDTILVEFSDTDLQHELAPDGLNDAVLRHMMGIRFAWDVRADLDPADLDRLLSVAREKEEFCRAANDLFGLGRCLGNQAIIQNARGRLEDALDLLIDLKLLSRRLDDKEGLAFALIQQAALLDNSFEMPAEAFPLAEQGLRLALMDRVSELASYGERVLSQIRSRLQP